MCLFMDVIINIPIIFDENTRIRLIFKFYRTGVPVQDPVAFNADLHGAANRACYSAATGNYKGNWGSLSQIGRASSCRYG